MPAELLKAKIEALKFNIRIEENNYQSALEKQMHVVRLIKLRMKIKKLKIELEVLLETLGGTIRD